MPKTESEHISTEKRPIVNSRLQELHGGQRLVYLSDQLKSGERVDTKEFSERLGVSRQNVYRMLRELSDMGVPVTNCEGRWMLLQFVPE